MKLTSIREIPLEEGIRKFVPTAKAWLVNDLQIFQSIDTIDSTELLNLNFGTISMPLGKYKHTSVSHPTRYPTWEEIKAVKEEFHGDVFVFQALPPKKCYVNVHANCFHLWEVIEVKI